MIVMRSGVRRFRCRSLAKKRIAQRQPSSLTALQNWGQVAWSRYE